MDLELHRDFVSERESTLSVEEIRNMIPCYDVFVGMDNLLKEHLRSIYNQTGDISVVGNSLMESFGKCYVLVNLCQQFISAYRNDTVGWIGDAVHLEKCSKQLEAIRVLYKLINTFKYHLEALCDELVARSIFGGSFKSSITVRKNLLFERINAYVQEAFAVYNHVSTQRIYTPKVEEINVVDVQKVRPIIVEPPLVVNQEALSNLPICYYPLGFKKEADISGRIDIRKVFKHLGSLKSLPLDELVAVNRSTDGRLLYSMMNPSMIEDLAIYSIYRNKTSLVSRFGNVVFEKWKAIDDLSSSILHSLEGDFGRFMSSGSQFFSASILVPDPPSGSETFRVKAIHFDLRWLCLRPPNDATTLYKTVINASLCGVDIGNLECKNPYGGNSVIINDLDIECSAQCPNILTFLPRSASPLLLKVRWKIFYHGDIVNLISIPFFPNGSTSKRGITDPGGEFIRYLHTVGIDMVRLYSPIKLFEYYNVLVYDLCYPLSLMKIFRWILKGGGYFENDYYFSSIGNRLKLWRIIGLVLMGISYDADNYVIIKSSSPHIVAALSVMKNDGMPQFSLSDFLRSFGFLQVFHDDFVSRFQIPSPSLKIDMTLVHPLLSKIMRDWQQLLEKDVSLMDKWYYEYKEHYSI